MHSDTEDGQGHDGDEDAALRRRHFPVSSTSEPAQVSRPCWGRVQVAQARLRPQVAGTAGLAGRALPSRHPEDVSVPDEQALGARGQRGECGRSLNAEH